MDVKGVDVSIAVPTYNRKEMLKDALACLTRQETDELFSYEVVVIDDLSTDGTKEVVLEIAKKSLVPVRYVLGRGMGYTHALNTAVAEIRGDWLTFFDDDQLTHGQWLKSLYCTAKEQDASLVGGPIKLAVPDEVYESMGPVYMDICGQTQDITHPQRFLLQDPLPPGGNRMVKCSIFKDIGTFDETMLTGGCDREFLVRALDAGYKTAWAPDADIQHCIPVNRIAPKYIKWYSLQWGCSFAYQELKRFGKGHLFFLALARIGQAFVVNIPVLLLSHLKNNTAEIKDRKALLWRAVGFVRKTLNILAPAFFPQESFFSKVEFRRSRPNEESE